MYIHISVINKYRRYIRSIRTDTSQLKQHMLFFGYIVPKTGITHENCTNHTYPHTQKVGKLELVMKYVCVFK